jgi:ribosomal-protein-alanine N-acetyltransferase
VTDFRIERIDRAEDLDGVVAIEQASFQNPTTRAWYEGELQRPDVCFIFVVRTPEHAVSAFCAFWRVADQIHINNLAVHPDLRRRGIGARLLHHVLEEADRLAVQQVTLEVRRSNDIAQRLYARAGFHPAGVRAGYYTQPVEDALMLVRRLATPAA